MKEAWEKIKGYDEYYEISNKGNVRSLYKAKTSGVITLKPVFNNKGYLTVGLHLNNINKRHSIHRLVAEAFIPKPPDKNIVNHINGISTDNNVNNLEWCTLSENQYHRYAVLGHKGALLGKKFSAKTKRLMSDKKCISVMCVETGEVFRSAKDASTLKHICKSSIARACKDITKLCGGFHWVYSPSNQRNGGRIR